MINSVSFESMNLDGLTANQIRLLKYMYKHDITNIEATKILYMTGGTFTKTISDLIAKGFNIVKWWECYKDKYGNPKRFKVYSWRQ